MTPNRVAVKKYKEIREKLEKALKKPDYTSGKVLKNLILFALPLALATFMQMLFNAVDIAIVGQFGDSRYQAAVGATSASVHLIVNLFVGISSGANVLSANAYGAKDEKRLHEVTHTSIATAVASGFIILFLGLFCSRPLMKLIKTPDEIIWYSTIYMQIYLAGAPAMMVYNFGASLLRGVGETKKPLYYLLVAGIINVAINLITVIFFHWHVIGVALGTTLSQCVAAVWITYDLIKGKYGIKLHLKDVKFYKKEEKRLLKIGIPMGISSCLYSVSNLFVQSSVNAYGEFAIAGNTVASNLATMPDSVLTSLERGIITFVGQNMGANKKERVNRIVGAGMVATAVWSAFVGVAVLLFGKYLCMIYNTDPVVIDWAVRRLTWVLATQIFSILIHTYGAALRGMGYSFSPMLINLVFTCIFRIVYIFFVYAKFSPQYIEQVYIIYPITWIASGLVQMIQYYYCGIKNGLFKKTCKEQETITK